MEPQLVAVMTGHSDSSVVITKDGDGWCDDGSGAGVRDDRTQRQQCHDWRPTYRRIV